MTHLLICCPACQSRVRFQHAPTAVTRCPRCGSDVQPVGSATSQTTAVPVARRIPQTVPPSPHTAIQSPAEQAPAASTQSVATKAQARPPVLTSRGVTRPRKNASLAILVGLAAGCIGLLCLSILLLSGKSRSGTAADVAGGVHGLRGVAKQVAKPSTSALANRLQPTTAMPPKKKKASSPARSVPKVAPAKVDSAKVAGAKADSKKAPSKSAPKAQVAAKPAAPKPSKKSPAPAPRRLRVDEIVAKCDPSVALISGQSSTGTGFLLEPGILATNQHVVSGQAIDRLKIHFPAAPANKRGPYSAKLLWKDEVLDVAFLKVETDLPHLQLNTKYSFRKGQEVTIIGNPGIGGQVLQNAVTRGVMSTKVKLDKQDFHQISAAVNPGNSGGPVFDAWGRVIGIITRKADRQEGIAFSIPPRTLTDCLKKLHSQTPGQLKRVAVVHQVEMTVLRYAVAGDLCKAMTASGLFEQLTRDSRALIRKDLLVIHNYLLKPYETAIDALLADTSIDAELRKGIQDLRKNYTELRVAMAGGTKRSVLSRINFLCSRHDALVSACSRRLRLQGPIRLTVTFDLKTLDGKWTAQIPR